MVFSGFGEEEQCQSNILMFGYNKPCCCLVVSHFFLTMGRPRA